MILAHAIQGDDSDVLLIVLSPQELAHLLGGGCLTRTPDQSDCLPDGWSLGILAGNAEEPQSTRLRQVLEGEDPDEDERPEDETGTGGET